MGPARRERLCFSDVTRLFQGLNLRFSRLFIKLYLQGLLVSAFILTNYKNVFCFIYPKVTPLAASACMCTVSIIQTQACNMYVTHTHNIHAHVAIIQVFSLRTRCPRLSAREWTHKPDTFFL